VIQSTSPRNVGKGGGSIAGTWKKINTYLGGEKNKEEKKIALDTKSMQLRGGKAPKSSSECYYESAK